MMTTNVTHFFEMEKPGYCRIARIAVQNFRCFPEFIVDLNSDEREIQKNGQIKTVGPLTVIVARNGMGKTTVLDAIRIAYGTFTSGFSYKSFANIQRQDIRIEKDNSQQVFPVVIDAVAALANTPFEWIRSIQAEGQQTKTLVKNKNNLGIRRIDGNPFKDFQRKFQGAYEETDPFVLPIIASYGTNRLWKKTNKKDKRRNLVTNRTWGYSSCLDAAANYTEAFGWLTDAIIARLNEKQVGIQQNQTLNDQLQAVESALTTVLEQEGYCPPLHLDPFFQELAIVQKNSDNKISVPVSQMSDGVKAVFFMVADIAFRCAKLNPLFKENAAKLTPGIVLIDEVDMHLHPSWQQKVLDTLQWAFPQIQFIVTTHSPQVVSSVPSESVRIIENGNVYSACGSEGADSARILEDIFGTSSFPKENRQRKRLKQYLDLVYAGKWKDPETQQLRSELDKVYCGKEPLLTDADLHIENEKWEAEHPDRNDDIEDDSK